MKCSMVLEESNYYLMMYWVFVLWWLKRTSHEQALPKHVLYIGLLLGREMKEEK